MAFDSVGMLRAVAAGNLTATGNGTGLQIDGTPASGVGIRIHVPQATGTTPTFDCVIADSPDNSTWKARLTFDQITVAGQYRQRLVTKQKYVRFQATVAGTSPNFGVVQIGFETGGEYKDLG
jgi:hypothetical protein